MARIWFGGLVDPASSPQILRAHLVDVVCERLRVPRALHGQHVVDDPNFSAEVGPYLVGHALDVEIPVEKDHRATP